MNNNNNNTEEYPKGKYAEKTLELQELLYQKGFLEITDIDGYFGPITQRALDAYMFELEQKPLPVKPWWNSNRGKGMAKFGAGILVSLVAVFWAGAENVDVGQSIDIIYEAGPQIDQAIQIGKSLIELAGALLLAFGFGQSAVGAIKAKQPLDPTLVAKVRGKEIRFPVPKKTATEKSHDIWLNSD
jgi:peptidoglycan hydrolase-like protein with peptidoglycan-binding domain